MTDTLRIMHISTRLILGGSQENTVLSCEGQADDGHDVALVHGPIFGPEGSMRERVLAHGGIECMEAPSLVRELAPRRDLRAFGECRRLIRDWVPDVVHTHSSKAGILGRAAAWSEHVPAVIHTIHGLAFHPYQSRWRNATYIHAERYAARRCHRIACVAEAMRDQALAAGIGTPEMYEIVYSGMDTASYIEPGVDRAAIRSRLGLPDEAFVLGTVARLAELKGHDDLLDALAPVMRERCELMLLWVGDGWWRDRLFRRRDELGLTNRIVTTGLVPPEEVPKLLAGIDVLAHPSYREGLPRTVTQSLLGGHAVVAYDVDGTREVCIDGETGRLVTPGDLDGLRDAVEWMMDHPRERASMGRRGQAMCRSRFDARAMVDHLDRLYRDVLAETSAARGGSSPA